MNVEKISAITITVNDMARSVASVNLIWPLLIFSFGPTLW